MKFTFMNHQYKILTISSFALGCLTTLYVTQKLRFIASSTPTTLSPYKPLLELVINVYKSANPLSKDTAKGKTKNIETDKSQKKIDDLVPILEGEFDRSTSTGRGRITYPSGRVEIGSFEKGQLIGIATVICKDNSVCTGTFKEGLLEGPGGSIIHLNGSSYYGEFLHHQVNGNGKISTQDGRIAEGSFKNNQLEGPGKITFPENITLTGFFSNGQPIGQATVTNHAYGVDIPLEFSKQANGKTRLTFLNLNQFFEGEIDVLWPEGHGKARFANGSTFEGFFIHGSLIKGVHIDNQGTIYEGQFQQDLLNGEGKITFLDGSREEGFFVDNLLTGKGKKVSSKGKIEEGEFIKGVLVQEPDLFAFDEFTFATSSDRVSLRKNKKSII